ncbi:MAG: DUF3488 and DUF4129 domain-containing transglutaminase family protein [Phycisphaeraceae bacterium JB051]
MNQNHYTRWVLLTLILTALPGLFVLPLWVGGIVLIASALPYITPIRGKVLAKLIVIGLLAGASAGVWLSFDSLFSGKSVLSFFVIVVFLKWAEARTRRDYLLLIFASVILAAIGALYWENLLSALHMLIVIFSMTMSLVAIHGDPTVLKRSMLFRCAGQLYLLGLPLMLLLFVTFPRIPGPLWDIGLAFGLPVKALMDRGSSDFGKVTSLAPGDSQQGIEGDDQTVVIAEFKGAVPYKSDLYWRGPVYYDYNGVTWNLAEGWDNRTQLLGRSIRSKAALDRELVFKSDPVRYTLHVMPNGGRWLFALDVPAAPAPEAFISSDFQLLSIRRIDDKEPKFPMLSYLKYRLGSTLSDEVRQQSLAWPKDTNPRLLALGQELASKHQDSEELVVQGLSLLAGGDYQFDAAHLIEPGSDTLDRFFFDEKQGGAEYLAGSFAMLMRAAGVPARLVSGYRGGTLIALTNFIIVKQSNAHAWVEVWHDGKGWQRVEPKDIIQPPVEKRKTVLAKETEISTPKIKLEEDQTPPVTSSSDKPQTKPQTTSPTRSKRWELPSFASLLGSMQSWVINYNPDRQMQVLKGVGMEESNWLDLMLVGLGGVVSLLSVYFVFAWWRRRKPMDSVTKSWTDFCNKLQKLGIPKMPHECPRDYLQRTCEQKPELTEALEDITARYIEIRYGDNDNPKAAAMLKQQVQRFIAMS